MAMADAMRHTETGRASHEVSLLYLYGLRVVYGLIAFFMGMQMWPLLLNHREWPDVMHGVAVCMLAAMAMGAVIGIRHPLKMLPLIFVEIFWKTSWLLAVALPYWNAHHAFDADMFETFKACAMGIIFFIVMPWRYVWDHYVKARGDRWW